MRGPKPKPTKLKILNGNPGKRPLPENEPEPTGEVVMPLWLSGGAVELWNHYAPELVELGLLTSLDCEKFAQWCKLASLFREVGPVGMAANLIARMDAISSAFGMDPGSRARLGSTKKKKDTTNPFQALA